MHMHVDMHRGHGKEHAGMTVKGACAGGHPPAEAVRHQLAIVAEGVVYLPQQDPSVNADKLKDMDRCTLPFSPTLLNQQGPLGTML